MICILRIATCRADNDLRRDQALREREHELLRVAGGKGMRTAAGGRGYEQLARRDWEVLYNTDMQELRYEPAKVLPA